MAKECLFLKTLLREEKPFIKVRIPESGEEGVFSKEWLKWLEENVVDGDRCQKTEFLAFCVCIFGLIFSEVSK